MSLVPSAGYRSSVHEMFQEQASRTPDATAVIHGDAQLSYAELDSRSRRMAGLLASRQISRGHLVAVLLDRSVNLVVALLGILRSGAGYVPLSPHDPPSRMKFILRDSGASLVMTSARIHESSLGDDVERERIIYVDEGGAADVQAHVMKRDIAYVIYTSGSTGKPKGVVIEHGALSVYLGNARMSYGSAAGRSLLHSSVSFDMAVTSIYTPLISGGCVEVADLAEAEATMRGGRSALRPTFLKVTPSHLPLLNMLAPRYAPTEQLVLGGEMLAGTAVDRWRTSNPSVTIVNEYGPTEATVGCCAHYVRPGDVLTSAPVPIGDPTDGTKLYVLDHALRPVAPGTAGELYIAGDQLARGYLGRPGLTGSAFIANPFGRPGSRMYRSGDIARQREDGKFEFLGRVDQQVKIRGYRIEPGEIAAAIAAGSQVSQVAVVARDSETGVKILVAYVVLNDGERFSEAALREQVQASLPAYMMPAQFIQLGALPLTSSGKVDISALPMSAAADENGREPVKASADLLRRLFSDLTEAAHVGMDDDFFALGGNSLAAARLVARARREGMDLTLQDVLAKRTVRQIARDVAADLPTERREDANRPAR
jgi:amino acid adenylation domain-containing protein